MGPMTLFDKSFLQMLTVDEAVMFDHFFMTSLCPVFLIEVLGDLAKDGSDPQRMVETLARKTPCRHIYPNAFHLHLVRDELAGGIVEVEGHPAVLGGRYVRNASGLHLVHEVSPEVEAFNRWTQGEFLEIERGLAVDWRSSISKVDLRKVAEVTRVAKSSLGNVRTLDDARASVTALIDGGNQWSLLKTIATSAGLGDQRLARLQLRWRKAGYPPVRSFAPFATHMLQVDLLFELALALSQISDDRPSNRVDMLYLYYLPFCSVFVSQDRLHRRLAPLLLRPDQSFVWGSDLKSDLALLEETLANELSDEDRAKGLMTMEASPPSDHDGLVSQLWDRHAPGWRNRKKAPKLSAEKERELVEKILAQARGTRLPSSFRPSSREKNAATYTFKRAVPRQLGRWLMLPPNVK